MKKMRPTVRVGKVLSYGMLLLLSAMLTTAGSVDPQPTSGSQGSSELWPRASYLHHRLELTRHRERGEDLREFTRLRESLSLQKALAQTRTNQAQPPIFTQQSVVQIAAFSLSDSKYSKPKPGSGVVVHPSGIILTNSHVIRSNTGMTGCGTPVRGDLAQLFIILITEAADQPPVPRFAATYIDDDQNLDAALLQIDKRIGARIKDIAELEKLLKDKSEEEGLRALNLSSIVPSEELVIEPLQIWDSRVLQPGLPIIGQGYPEPGVGAVAVFTSSLGEVLAEIELPQIPQPTVPNKEVFFHIEQILAWGGISGGAVIDRESGFLVGIVCGGIRLQDEITQLARAIRINDIFKRFSAHLGGLNRPPVARFSTTPFNPELDAPVELDAFSSSDIDGKVVKYEWDFNGDGLFDSEGPKLSHVFRSKDLTTDLSGVLSDPEVRLQVTDDQGETHTQVQRVILTRKTSCSVRLQLPGRAAQAFDSIQSAIVEVASAKEKRPATVEVSGTCQEKDSVLIEGLKSITLKGAVKPVLFGVGNRPVLIIRGSEDITIEGLTVRGGLHGVQVTNSNKIRLSNNVIEANLERGIDLRNSYDLEVIGNTLRANGREGLSLFVAAERGCSGCYYSKQSRRRKRPGRDQLKRRSGY